MESVLLVPVGEAEPATRAHRQVFDSAARDGIDAHITLLYPFKDPQLVTPQEHDALFEMFGQLQSFEYELHSTGWFGDSVLFLKPTFADRFTRITNQLVEWFPDCQPYGGTFEENIPHLTVADEGSLLQLREVESQLLQSLPISATAQEVLWMAGTVGSQWHEIERFEMLRNGRS